MARRLVTRNPPLLGLFLVTFAWIAWFAAHIHVYSVMPDEVRTVKQAIDIASRLRPLVPGDPDFATWSQVQPLLMAPLWGVFATPRAYALTHWLNAFVMASSVFPAYLLALRVLGRRGWALIAAALVILVPWTLMAGLMLTEVSAYPAAIWAYYGLQRAATGRGPREDLIGLGLLALAFFSHVELIVLSPVLPIVLVAQGLRYPEVRVERPTRRLRTLIRRHWVAFGATLVVALLFALRAHSFVDHRPALFGAGWDVTVRGLLTSTAIGVAMLPLVVSTAWAAGTLWRPRDEQQHAFAVIAALATLAITLLAGGAAAHVTASFGDRYLAYLAPLLMIGLLAGLLEPRPWRGLIVVAAVATAWLAWNALLTPAGPSLVSPTASWRIVLDGHAPEIGRWFGLDLNSAQLMAGCALVAGVLLALARSWLRPPVVAAAVALLVGGYAFAETTYARHKIEGIQPAAGYATGRNWVDRTLLYGTQADAILSSLGSDHASATTVWWDLTFWNGQVRGEQYLQPSTDDWSDQAAPRPFSIDPADGAISGDLGRHGYVIQGVSDRRFGLRGATPIGTPTNNLQILQVPAPVSALWTWHGPDETGLLAPGATARVRVFGDGLAGHRAVALALGTPFNATRPSRYRVTGPGGQVVHGTVAVGTQALPQIVLDMPASGHVDLTLKASGTRQGVQFAAAGLGAPIAG